ncbi:hypothetical protein [uncultured Microbulbifer sp.]|uniref:hypothetical protein n=1 Tax=uncultured Microbulbifer sp. TaxID=348147 RepID=UPI00260F1479|nr:hypothetical protein [uncultured Microbulbifer sp.]
MNRRDKIQKLLSDALGYEVDLTPKRLTKRERLEQKISDLRDRQIKRISKGRTRGAGAGGYNRDIESIVHQIRLIEIELEELEELEETGNS